MNVSHCIQNDIPKPSLTIPLLSEMTIPRTPSHSFHLVSTILELPFVSKVSIRNVVNQPLFHEDTAILRHRSGQPCCCCKKVSMLLLMSSNIIPITKLLIHGLLRREVLSNLGPEAVKGCSISRGLTDSKYSIKQPLQ